MQTKYKHLTEQEFRVIRALTAAHKTAEVARIAGRSYGLVKRVQSVENFDEYRKDFRKPGPKPKTPYMDQMIELLTEIRNEMKKYNDKTDAKLEKASKRRWF